MHQNPTHQDLIALVTRLESGGALPTMTETKHRYDGGRESVSCRVLESDRNRTVLFHRIARDWDVGTVGLVLGDVTVAFYFRDTPYNLYCWFSQTGAPIARYFNVVAPGGYWTDGASLHYEDRILDVLIPAGGEPQVLDRKEIAVLDEHEQARVDETAEFLVSNGEVIAEGLLQRLADSVNNRESVCGCE